MTSLLTNLTLAGLGYLALDRPTATLSGGERQRIRTVMHRHDPAMTGYGWTDTKPVFWMIDNGTVRTNMHLALTAADRDHVHHFYDAAITAGPNHSTHHELTPSTTSTTMGPSSSTDTESTSKPSAIALSSGSARHGGKSEVLSRHHSRPAQGPRRCWMQRMSPSRTSVRPGSPVACEAMRHPRYWARQPD